MAHRIGGMSRDPFRPGHGSTYDGFRRLPQRWGAYSLTGVANSSMNVDLPIWETLIRLALAVTLGGLIGWEREHRGKPAGLRTNMMVSLGAATFTLMAVGLLPESGATDPSRIVTGVATGIGFLGAGSILKSNGNVTGITTAAGIWVVGSLGAASGVGAYSVAVAATVVALIVLHVFGMIEARTMPDHRGCE